VHSASAYCTPTGGRVLDFFICYGLTTALYAFGISRCIVETAIKHPDLEMIPEMPHFVWIAILSIVFQTPHITGMPTCIMKLSTLKAIQTNQVLLKEMASRYIWWKTPDVALQMPLHVMAQVMAIGMYDDMHLLACRMGDDALRDVLLHAQAGWFDARAWAYWHYRLDMCAPGAVPTLPIRKIPGISDCNILSEGV